MNNGNNSVSRLWIRGLAPGVLIGVGFLHSYVGLSGGWGMITQMAAEGFWNTIPPGSSVERTRPLLLWFLVSGFWLIMLGHLGFWYERTHRRPLPPVFAIELLVFAVVVGVVSGGAIPAWLFAAAAVYLLVINHRTNARPWKT